jgi:hypothetical protein
LGWEFVTIPADFASTHQPVFDFPYSHGLVAGIVWSACAGAGAWAAFAHLGPARARGALLVAATVFSHWLLDALVHQPELPLTGASSPNIGLGLWRHMPIALAAETVIVAIGLLLFVPGRGLSRGKSLAVTAMTVLLLALTAAGMTIAPPPPSAQAMAASSLVALAIVCALTCWLGKRPRAAPA